MRISILKKVFKVSLLIIVMVIVIQIIFSIIMMWRSNRIADKIIDSQSAWQYKRENVKITIYNKENLPNKFSQKYGEICECISSVFYNNEYSSEEIKTDGTILFLILQNNQEERYFSLVFDSAGSFFEQGACLIEYNEKEKTLDDDNSILLTAKMNFNSEKIKLVFEDGEDFEKIVNIKRLEGQSGDG